MKLDTAKYKLTIYTETTCPGCIELKSLLKENAIPFHEKDITKDTTKSTMPHVGTYTTGNDNRWEFIDITREYPGETLLVPLISVEHIDGNITHHSANYDFDEAQEGLELLKQYSI
jgi:glutaredoxin